MALLLDQIVVPIGQRRLTASLSVDAGTRVAVMGPSGAGKSTLLSALAGFLPILSGNIRWAGADFGGALPGDRPLSILFQDQNLFPHLSVAKNVGLGLRPDLRLGKDGWVRVSEALDRVGLAGTEARRPASLSGGQQSRVALARVLLRKRPLLLLDEAFAGLGPALKAEMLDLVQEISADSGTTVLMVTHDPGDAQRFAEQCLVVSDLIVGEPLPVDEVLAAKTGPLADYLGDQSAR